MNGRRNRRWPARVMPALMVLATSAVAVVALAAGAGGEGKSAALPAAVTKGKMSVAEALAKRRSVRQYTAEPLTRQQIGQLCWAAQGVTEPKRGFRTAPSAGGLYPLELYVVTADGVEHYVPGKHELRPQRTGDVRRLLQAAALRQRMVGEAPATFVFTAVVARTARKYGPPARKYVLMESGHAAQNLLLQATALGLGAVPIGAFDDLQVAKILALPAEQEPIYLISVGKPRD